MISEILFETLLHPADTWSHVLKRGTSLRLTDMEGGANVGVILYNFECPSERLNLPDTLKAQHIARLTKSNVLYSDMGRVLCSITNDTIGWHDPLGGCSNARMVKAKYGEARYQECRNDFFKNGRDSFLIELSKYGLGPRDLCPNINFFSKVTVAEDGSIAYQAAHSRAGDLVDLRTEMNVLAILTSCPHPLDPSTTYNPKPVHLLISRVAAPTPADPCRTSCPENQRGFTLTERYFM